MQENIQEIAQENKYKEKYYVVLDKDLCDIKELINGTKRNSYAGEMSKFLNDTDLVPVLFSLKDAHHVAQKMIEWEWKNDKSPKCPVFSAIMVKSKNIDNLSSNHHRKSIQDTHNNNDQNVAPNTGHRFYEDKTFINNFIKSEHNIVTYDVPIDDNNNINYVVRGIAKKEYFINIFKDYTLDFYKPSFFNNLPEYFVRHLYNMNKSIADIARLAGINFSDFEPSDKSYQEQQGGKSSIEYEAIPRSNNTIAYDPNVNYDAMYKEAKRAYLTSKFQKQSGGQNGPSMDYDPNVDYQSLYRNAKQEYLTEKLKRQYLDEKQKYLNLKNQMATKA